MLVLPETARPANLVVSPGCRPRVLTSDIYDICQRVRELDPSLYIVELDADDPRPYRYVIMERCRDGVDRIALRVREGELDGRVIEKLRYQLAVPLSERVRRLEREGEAWERAEREKRLDQLVDSLAPRFQKLLHDCNFVHTPRPTSYPTRAIRPTNEPRRDS